MRITEPLTQRTPSPKWTAFPEPAACTKRQVAFGGISGGMFSAIQGFVSPESFILVESIMVLSLVVLGGMGNVWGVVIGAVLLSFVPEILRFTVEPAQRAVFGRMLIDPEVIRMLRFGLALVLMMLFRPAGILPSALRKRELETKRAPG